MLTIHQGSAGAALTQAIEDLGPLRLLPCAGETVSGLWFSESRVDQNDAAKACRGCPVQPLCLAAAEERGERHGVWGGVAFPASKANASGN